MPTTLSDTTPPTSTITQSLLNDTGVSNLDFITSNGHVTITGQASEQVEPVGPARARGTRRALVGATGYVRAGGVAAR